MCERSERHESSKIFHVNHCNRFQNLYDENSLEKVLKNIKNLNFVRNFFKWAKIIIYLLDFKFQIFRFQISLNLTMKTENFKVVEEFFKDFNSD